MLYKANKLLVFLLIIILINGLSVSVVELSNNYVIRVPPTGETNNNDLGHKHVNVPVSIYSHSIDQEIHSNSLIPSSEAGRIKQHLFMNPSISEMQNREPQLQNLYTRKIITPKIKPFSFSDGDWIVTGQELVQNEEVILNGNLIIESGGNLTFIDVTLYVNCSYDGEFQIKVKSGGAFYILGDSVITSYNSSYSYLFYVDKGAKFRMINSELHYCGYSYDYVGLVISTSDAIFQDCLFSRNYYGVYINWTSLSLTNCIFQENTEYGIYAYRSNVNLTNCSFVNNKRGISYFKSNGNIVDCNFEKNEYGIDIVSYSDYYCKITIDKCKITENTYSGIVSTYSYMTISNCNISYNNAGIYCMFSHVNVSNCYIYGNYGTGAFFEGDKVKIRIWNCGITKNDGDGIHAGRKTNIYVYNCTLSLNKRYGIDLLQANLTIINCSICNNEFYGLYLGYSFSSYYNVKSRIINNTFINNTIYLEGYELKEFFHKIENNTVNGKPLYYIVNRTNYVVPPEAGALIIVNSTNLIIRDFLFSYVQIPVFLAYVRDTLLENLTLNDNLWGIHCFRSKNITINGITAYNNRYNSIYLYESNGTISNVRTEQTDGIVLKGSRNARILNCSIKLGEYGIVLWFSHDVLIENCSLSFNDYSGFLCSDSTNITLKELKVYNNSEKATLLGLGAIDCTGSSVKVIEGLIYNNDVFGIRLMKSSIEVIGSFIFNNTEDGVYAEESTAIIKATNITQNCYGIYGYRSSIIVNNSILCENREFGVYGYESELDVVDSLIFGNEDGIGFIYSNARISKNTIYNNENDAIHYTNSNANISNNLIYENGEFGIHFSSNIISNIMQNTFIGDGIFMYGSAIEYFVHNIENNTVNGKPLYYFLNIKNITISGDIGAIILVNSTDMLICNTNISLTDAAIELAYSNNIKIENLTLKGNKYGIYSTNSRASIMYCEITNNKFGISIYENSPLEVHYCNIYSNSKFGICNQDYYVGVNATYNWWGSPEGPVQTAMADAVDPEEIYGNITYEPWLTFHWPDAISPSIQILSPMNNSYVRSIAVINASVIDNESGVLKVIFYIDEILVYEDYEAPYEFEWNTSMYNDGEHKIKVQAYDNFGNTAEKCIVVIVDNTPPTIGIPSRNPEHPLEGEEVTISVEVWDNTSGIATVILIYEANGEVVSINMAYNGAMWVAVIPGKPANTVVTYRITAYDAAGNNATSDTYSYTVGKSQGEGPRAPVIFFPSEQYSRILFLFTIMACLVFIVVVILRKRK